MTASTDPGAGSILVLTLHSGGHYYGEMLAGVLQAAAQHERHVVVAETRDPGDDRRGERSWGPAFSIPLAWDQVAGVVCVANSATHAYLDSLRAAGYPVVVANPVSDAFRDTVTAGTDNAIAIEAAVQHLVDHGHKRIGFVGSLDLLDFNERYDTYQSALTAHGLTVDEDLYFPAADYSPQSGAAAAVGFLAHPDPPSAVITTTDGVAMGLIAELTAAGVRVPEDVAVLGFDNAEDGAYTRPSLSSVGQRFQEVGALATSLLIDLIDGVEVPPGAYTPTTVVLTRRASCGCRSDLRSTDQGARSIAPPLNVHRPVDSLVAAAPVGDYRDTLLWAIKRVETLALGAEQPDDDALAEVAEALHRIAADHDEVSRIAADLTEHVVDVVAHAQATGGEEAPVAGHGRVEAMLWELRAQGHRGGERRLDESAIELETVASALLRTDGDDTRSLTWLSSTHVRAGVLALWDGPISEGRLRIAGVHDPLGLTGHTVGDVVDVRDFPGQKFAAATAFGTREMCFILPVASRSRSWGLLTLLGRIDTGSVREPYHHMTELLYRALEAEQLEGAVRASEERYAWAARASNDGLWEIDVESQSIFLSARCRELLGLPSDGPLAVEDWTNRILPEDREQVEAAMISTLSTPGRPVELEYRLDTGAAAVDDTGYGENVVPSRWVLSRALSVPGDDGSVARIVGSLADVTPRRELEDRLRQAAMYDDVTGLANRRLFLERLSAAVSANRRDARCRFAVIFLDLDGFKLINDSLGHLAGDDLLRAVAERMRSAIRGVDTAARFGGDEFAVLLADPVSDELLGVAQRLQQRLGRPIRLGDHDVTVTASVGIATSESGYTSAEDVLRDADTAMYQSKETQRGTATVFDQRMHERASRRLRSRSEIRSALDSRQFVVHYQPIVRLDGGTLDAFEALVRWEHPERGLLMPGHFLPAMEDTDAIVALGRFVVDEVCRQLAVWRDEGRPPVRVSVNVSNLEFWDDGLVTFLTQAAERHGVPTSSLVAEITESVIMSDVERAGQIMDELRSRGFRLHVDDFGTGHSSLQTLQNFPVDTLKIDGSFIRDLVSKAARPAVIVRAVVAMAAGLGMDVIAECVETPEQADLLREMGCSNAQGWLYARAVPGDEAGELVGRRLGDAVRTA